MGVIEEVKTKKCENHCPNCGAYDEVVWGEWVTGDCVYVPGECGRCGCHFHQYYTYSDTEFEVGKVPRIPCFLPMRNFYDYLDEVPIDTRVSTLDDCEKCKEPISDNGCEYCLISTKNGSKCFFEKQEGEKNE